MVLSVVSKQWRGTTCGLKSLGEIMSAVADATVRVIQPEGTGVTTLVLEKN